MRPRPPRCSGMTLPEFLIVAVVVVFLLSCLPICCAPTSAIVKGQQTQVLSNMKQLHLATQQMALDGITTTNPALGWPGDTGGSFTNWAQRLVGEDYLSTNDLSKLLSTPGLRLELGQVPGANTNGVLLYAVRADSATNAVFLTSANFTNTPTGGLRPGAQARPFGQRGFVVFRRDGSGLILRPSQAGETNAVGAFVPLCR